MERTKYLIDTNAVIDYLGNKLSAKGMNFMNGIIDGAPNVSIVTKIEVLGFNASDQHYEILSNFINDVSVLDLTNNVVDATIEIRKKYKAKLPDAIIAATAIVNDLILISRNISDFKNIGNLEVIDPHEI
jgi:predicted nucleic acid-binding protein